MPLALYLVEYLGAPRNHQAIFVRLSEGDGTGQLFHVKGDVQSGMTYESRFTKPPEQSASYVSMTQLGWVSSSDLQRIDDVCRSNPPPEKQFNGAKRINPKKPLRRCREWTSETIQQLQAQEILYEAGQNHSSYQSSGSTRYNADRLTKSSSQAQSSSRHVPVDGQTSGDGYWTWSAKFGDWYHVRSGGGTLWASQQGSRS